MSGHVPFEYAPAPMPDELTRHYARLGFQSSVTPGALMLRNQREFGRLRSGVRRRCQPDLG